MVGINKIILEHFSDPANPKELEEILKSFLDIESSDSIKKSGVDKLYDQILKKYANNKEFVEWCKDYVK